MSDASTVLDLIEMFAKRFAELLTAVASADVAFLGATQCVNADWEFSHSLCQYQVPGAIDRIWWQL